MDGSASITDAQSQSLIRHVHIPSVSKVALQGICSSCQLTRTGNKIDLQKRIVEAIQQAFESNDSVRFLQLRDSVYKYASAKSATRSASPRYPLEQSPDNPTLASAARVDTMHALPPLPTYRHVQPPTASFTFKPSPFYEIKNQIGDVRVCEVMLQNRHTVTYRVKSTDYPAMLQMATDPSMRILVFCAGANTGTQDVAFPHQVELKVNGSDIKANMRGLKNRPGTTRPVDITNELRTRPPTYNNNIEFVYALTQKKFYVVLYLCKTVSCASLVEQIRRGKRIAKASVVHEITKKADDPDVVTTSETLSLKCPISFSRLAVPCRAVSCNHIQCFDALSYLQLQEQSPQWLCPVCNKSAPFSALAIDEYVLDILTKTPNAEHVTIEPDGKWAAEDGAKTWRAESHQNSVVDDDELEISGFGVSTSSGNLGTSRSTAPPSRPPTGTSFGTPSTANVSLASRDSSQKRTNGKRPATQVIDLTLSDSDDDASYRAAKRMNYGQKGEKA